ncbi:hypothetical protein [Natronoarchaeum mannanilyticum]|uniref:Phosphate transporter n=1 Tax=Natronoarchaeum mannanilyticum TaxID=926360 RepID=A0AAV3T693_9EURY
MSDDADAVSVDAGPSEVPRTVALVTTATAIVGVAALSLTATSAAPALGAMSGGLLALGLARFEDARTPTREIARGVALVTASMAVGTLVFVAGQAPGAADVSVSLAALLWVAALGGLGVGRGSLSSHALTGGGVGAFAALLALGVLIPVFGGSILAAAGLVALLEWNVGAPAVGTVLALYGTAALIVGAVLGATPSAPDERRPINRQLRRRAGRAKRLGRRLLGAAGVAAIVGVLGGYRLLSEVATPLWRALAVATGSPTLRLVPVAVATVAVLAFAARAGAAWAWDEEGPDTTRVLVLTSGVGTIALIGLVAGATAALVRIPGGNAVVHPAALGDWSPIWGGLAAALVGTAVVLFGLRGIADVSDRRTALGPYVCAGGLLAASVVAALRGSGVVAPLVGIGAAAIVWDVGRTGATMGVELGADAVVERSALVRPGGSVAVGALATVVAVALAAGIRRIGPLVEQVVAGPVVLAVGVGAALVVALALYARKRASSPA